ncbi:MAG: AAA family ATPase [Candidatus Omnitrophica bacterium]|nr:AAA family ATPase [Candidatus Omnitrophota bacterium]
MKIIAISNQKGGCGKTTVATNLSAALAQKGQKTLLIDMDPQSHATIGLGILKVDPFHSIFGLFVNEIRKGKPIKEIATNLENNLDIVPSHIIMSTVEHELKEREDGLLILTKAINRSDLAYDYIVIDCPPNLGFLTFNALRAANEIIVPVEASAFSIMGVGKLISMVELIKIKLHHAPHVKGLVNMYDEYSDFAERMVGKIKYIFKDKLLKTIISFDISLRWAQEKSESIFKCEPKSRAAHDYLALADELLAFDREESSENIYQEMRKILHGVYGNVYSKEKVFRFYAPKAKEVYIVGDFNNWKMDTSNLLERKKNGDWEKSFYLLPGKYRYKFVVDGLWFWDPQNTEKEPNPYGDFDSVFQI